MPRSNQSHRVLIGLEIHVQLATASKMFTAVANASGSLKPGMEPPSPNSAVDAQILGLPGTLPVINRTAVEYSIKVGLALGCTISRFTKWDRKSYYYPDLPKNYQISQYDLPLCYDGRFDMVDESGEPFSVRIRRAHLEEDAGKLLHEAPGGYPIDHSIVDLNRAGTPLLEIVTEPDFTAARQVALFAQELQKLVQFLGVSEGQMQLGQMRFEPNINVHITDSAGQVHKTAITEIKNLNSFSVLERATAYEITRQLREWEETGSLGTKATRGWDETSGTTFLQREKEEAHDYRYFPDPDLVPVVVDEAWLMELKAQVGEMPADRKKRYLEQYRLTMEQATILSSDRRLGDFFDGCLVNRAKPERVATLLLSHGLRLANSRGRPLYELGIDPSAVDIVAGAIDLDHIAAASAGPIFDYLVDHPGAGVDAAIDALGLRQTSDVSAVDAAIDALIAQNPKSLQDFRAGKQAAFGSLVGMIMKGPGGRGLNPKVVQERLRERLA